MKRKSVYIQTEFGRLSMPLAMWGRLNKKVKTDAPKASTLHRETQIKKYLTDCLNAGLEKAVGCATHMARFTVHPSEFRPSISDTRLERLYALITARNQLLFAGKDVTKAALARGLELGNDNVRGSRQKSLERYLQSLGLSFDDVMNGILDKAVELDFSRTEQKPKKRATKKNKNAQS